MDERIEQLDNAFQQILVAGGEPRRREARLRGLATTLMEFDRTGLSQLDRQALEALTRAVEDLLEAIDKEREELGGAGMANDGEQGPGPVRV